MSLSKFSSVLAPLISPLLLSACVAEVGSQEPAQELAVSTQALGRVNTFEPTVPTEAIDAACNVIGSEQSRCTLYSASSGSLTIRGVQVEEAVQAALSMGRAAVASAAMQQCLQDMMVTGGQTYPISSTASWGPYTPIDDPAACGAGTASNDGVDPLNDGALSETQLLQRRKYHAMHVWQMAQAPNPMHLQCDRGDGVKMIAGSSGPHAQIDASEDLIVALGQFYFENLRTAYLNRFTTGSVAAFIREAANFDAVVWHEALHVQGYDHITAGKNLAPIHRTQAPHMLGECVFEVLRESDNCSISCAEGMYAIVDRNPVRGVTPGCECVADRDAVDWRQETHVIGLDAFDPTGEPIPGRVEVDSEGRGYVHWRDDTLWRFRESGSPRWELIASNVAWAKAGGRVVYIGHHDGLLLRYDPQHYASGSPAWDTMPTGADLPTGGEAFFDFVVDDIGNAYWNRSDGVYKLVHDAEPFIFWPIVQFDTWRWERIGQRAGKLFAGADHVFATDADDGTLWRYTHEDGRWTRVSTPGDNFRVDTHGVVYGFSNNTSGPIFQSLGDGDWKLIDFEPHTLTAGNRLYVLESWGGDLYEYRPGTRDGLGEFIFVTDGVLAAYAGGDAVFVRKLDGFELYRVPGTRSL